MSEDVSKDVGTTEASTAEEAPHEKKKKAYIRERKALVKIIVGSLKEYEKNLVSIQAPSTRIKAFKDAVHRLDEKQLKKICKSGQLRIGKELILFPGVKEASQRASAAFHVCIMDPILRSEMKTKKGREMNNAELEVVENKGIVQRILKSLGESGGTPETEPVPSEKAVEPVVDSEKKAEVTGSENATDPEDTVSQRTGKERLHPKFEKMTPLGKWIEIRRIKRELLNEAAVAELEYEANQSDASKLDAKRAVDRYLDFVFQMKGFDAAKKDREHIHKKIESLAQTVKERRRNRARGWLIGGLAAAGTTVAGIFSASNVAIVAAAALEAVRRVISSPGSTIALIMTALLYEYLPAKRFTKAGRDFSRIEKEAQQKGESFSQFEQENMRRIGKYESAKTRLKRIIALVGTAVAIGFWLLNWNEAVTEGISWLYSGSWLQSAIQNVTGFASSGLHELVQMFSGASGSKEAVAVVAGTGVAAETVSTASDATSSADIVGQGVEATPPIEPGIVPTDIPIEAQAGDGLTQVMQHLAEQGVTPSWFPQGMDIHSPDAWAQIVHQLGISGNGPIIHTGDTFWFTPDGTLMIDPVGGSPQIAITSSGTLGDFMQSRMRP